MSISDDLHLTWRLYMKCSVFWKSFTKFSFKFEDMDGMEEVRQMNSFSEPSPSFFSPSSCCSAAPSVHATSPDTFSTPSYTHTPHFINQTPYSSSSNSSPTLNYTAPFYHQHAGQFGSFLFVLFPCTLSFTSSNHLSNDSSWIIQISEQSISLPITQFVGCDWNDILATQATQLIFQECWCSRPAWPKEKPISISGESSSPACYNWHPTTYHSSPMGFFFSAHLIVVVFELIRPVTLSDIYALKMQWMCLV